MLKTITCPIYKYTQNSRLPAIITKDRTITYPELNALIHSFAKILHSKADRIVIDRPNSIEGIALLFACLRIEKTACLLSTRLPQEKREEIAQNLKAESIALRNIKFTSKEPEFIEYDLNSEATIMLTSGTTGSPKAVVHTIANHYYSARHSNNHLALDENDRWLLTLPIYHVGGLSILWRCFLNGATVVISKEEKDFPEEIATLDITHLSVVPTQLYRMLKNNVDLSGLKAILVGGAPINQHLIKNAIERNWPIYLTYGSTEMSSQIATSPLIRSMEDSLKISPLGDTEIKIKDNQIYVRGKTLCKGYLNNSIIDLPLEDGWFNTGDIGALYGSSCLMVKGRKDNMFISGGENIYPEEIEKLLSTHEKVEEAIVVPVDHAEFGKRPIAFIKGNVRKDELEKLLSGKCEKFKNPDAYYYMPEAKEIKPSRQTLKELLKNTDIALKSLD